MAIVKNLGQIGTASEYLAFPDGDYSKYGDDMPGGFAGLQFNPKPDNVPSIEDIIEWGKRDSLQTKADRQLAIGAWKELQRRAVEEDKEAKTKAEANRKARSDKAEADRRRLAVLELDELEREV